MSLVKFQKKKPPRLQKCCESEIGFEFKSNSKKKKMSSGNCYGTDRHGNLRWDDNDMIDDDDDDEMSYIQPPRGER